MDTVYTNNSPRITTRIVPVSVYEYIYRTVSHLQSGFSHTWLIRFVGLLLDPQSGDKSDYYSYSQIFFSFRHSCSITTNFLT